MANCTICEEKLPSAKRHNYYCSAYCKQRAYVARLPPERLLEMRRIKKEKGRLWRAANPERARELGRKWQADNREKTRINARRFHAKNPEYGRLSTLRRKYGLTPTDYERMFAEQGGLCAACGHAETTRHQSGKVKRLAVDHDHETGAVRGLLCKACNIAIGLACEDPARLDGAAAYLRRVKSRAIA